MQELAGCALCVLQLHDAKAHMGWAMLCVSHHHTQLPCGRTWPCPAVRCPLCAAYAWQQAVQGASSAMHHPAICSGTLLLMTAAFNCGSGRQ